MLHLRSLRESMLKAFPCLTLPENESSIGLFRLPFKVPGVTMPLAMLHLRFLHQSMLKAARPLEHLICRAMTSLFSALSARLAESFKATSILLS